MNTLEQLSNQEVKNINGGADDNGNSNNTKDILWIITTPTFPN
ncbi:hypothetical protein [Aquimarina pacifica]|nr:hypothetical protein [Aquimarina pacifica]